MNGPTQKTLGEEFVPNNLRWSGFRSQLVHFFLGTWALGPGPKTTAMMCVWAPLGPWCPTCCPKGTIGPIHTRRHKGDTIGGLAGQGPRALRAAAPSCRRSFVLQVLCAAGPSCCRPFVPWPSCSGLVYPGGHWVPLEAPWAPWGPRGVPGVYSPISLL